MKEFYIVDGQDFVLCTNQLKDDLIELCEDNEIMKNVIKNYFK